MQDPKHISQLSPTKRAIADQSIRDAMLAIVVGQGGKAVRIPIDDLDKIAATHRLVIEIDRAAGFVILTAEVAPAIVELAKPALASTADPLKH